MKTIGLVILLFVSMSALGTTLCDIDEDGDVDRIDISYILDARNTLALPGDPRDTDGNGIINVNDARQCVLLCTNARCLVLP